MNIFKLWLSPPFPKMISRKILFRSNYLNVVISNHRHHRRFLSTVKIEVTPKVSLMDEKVRTVVSGLRPYQKGDPNSMVVVNVRYGRPPGWLLAHWTLSSKSMVGSQCDQMAKLLKNISPFTAMKTCPISKHFLPK